MEPQFLIVVPSIRQSLPEFGPTLDAVRASLTVPTQLEVLDGRNGKAQALNWAFDALLVPSQAPVYVTLDDDLIPPFGWQDWILSAFAAVPSWGALGLWFAEDMHERILASRCGPEAVRGGISFRPVPHSIIGCLIAFRREVALQVGKIPANTERYQMWEDGWRCERVKHGGYELAYIVGEPPQMVWYRDPADYIDAKLADMEHSRQHMASYMAQGLRPGLIQRVKTSVRRIVQRG